MSLKWKEISLLLEEARPLMVGAALQKVAQVAEVARGESFMFHGFGDRGAFTLWNCLLQDHTCWVIAGEDWELKSQPTPSTFIMTLRKHAIGKRIRALEQVPGERIILMHLEENISLLFELLPKRANFLMVEAWNSDDRSGRFLGSFRQVSLETGAIYRLPPAPITALAPEQREFEMSGSEYPYHQAVGAHYWEGVQESGFNNLKRLWRNTLKSHSKKVNTAFENSRKDFEEAKEAELFQMRGKALVTHLYELGPKIFPQEKSIQLDGLEIPLDKMKNYADNAEVYFKKSKKMVRATSELEGRLNELGKKSEYLKTLAEKIEKAAGEDDLLKLAPAFEKEGLDIPDPNEQKEDKSASAKPFLEFKSSDGFIVYCGRNQIENRTVTFKEAKGNDLWMHVKGVPGAHVVVKGQRNKTVPLTTLLEAAQVCLYHSKIRKGKRAEVDYTQRKNVKAIKGTLSEVSYTGNKTIYVESDPEILRKILKN